LQFSRKYNEVVLGFNSSRQQDSGTTVVEFEPGPSSTLSPKRGLESPAPAQNLELARSPNIRLSNLPTSPQTLEPARSPNTRLSNPPTSPRSARCAPLSNMDCVSSLTPSPVLSKASQQATQEKRGSRRDDLDFAYVAERLQIRAIRPLQQIALQLLSDASASDFKIVQGPTSMGKDLLPFALNILTRKTQIVFVPFVALVESVVQEGIKYNCKVIRFSDIGKTVTMSTACATADVIVFSYEHAQRAIRIAHELISRDRLGNVSVITICVNTSLHCPKYINNNSYYRVGLNIERMRYVKYQKLFLIHHICV
jgi:hypothetical protein